MFTGIVEGIGRVTSIRAGGEAGRLGVDLGPLARGVVPGDSLAVDGVCLTAEALEGSRAEFRTTRETLERTLIGRRGPGSRVNLERSMRLGDRLGGHLVLGHVDGSARVAGIAGARGERRVRLRVGQPLGWILAPKASVAVNGVSLTVVDPGPGEFSVALVDYTLEHTTLGDLRVGDAVNVEGDVLGRWVAHLLRVGAVGPPGVPGGGSPLPLERLRELGGFGAGG